MKSPDIKSIKQCGMHAENQLHINCTNSIQSETKKVHTICFQVPDSKAKMSN